MKKDIELLESFHVDTPTKRWVPVEEYIAISDELEALKKQIADAPICYGKKYGTGWLASGEYQQPHDTHTMRLVDIKKIGEGE